MSTAYVLKGSNINKEEYLLVVRTESSKELQDIIDTLSASKIQKLQDLAFELEKSLYDNRRDFSKTGSKNKIKTAVGNDSKRRKAKDS
jgi:molybdate-binding protein